MTLKFYKCLSIHSSILIRSLQISITRETLHKVNTAILDWNSSDDLKGEIVSTTTVQTALVKYKFLISTDRDQTAERRIELASKDRFHNNIPNKLKQTGTRDNQRHVLKLPHCLVTCKCIPGVHLGKLLAFEQLYLLVSTIDLSGTKFQLHISNFNVPKFCEVPHITYL